MTDFTDVSQESAREAVANVAMALRDIGLQLRGANANVAAETCYDEWATRLERAVAKLDAAPGLWECEKCGFAFSREHENEGGGYSCPVCELATADKAIEALRVQVAAAEAASQRLTEALQASEATFRELEQIAASGDVRRTAHRGYELCRVALGAGAPPEGRADP